MISLRNVSYAHPNRDVLFTDINLNINKQHKIALIGNNGVGKSTLLKIMAGTIQPLSGSVKTSLLPYYMPQLFDRFNDLTIAQALTIEDKLNALKEILNGNVTVENMTLLNDDWEIEERCKNAFAQWQIEELRLNQKMNTLSGGQKTKVFLAGISIHQAGLVLLDEPSNHLDASGRKMLYDYIQSTNATLVVISHDRALLNILDTVYELSKHGIQAYGGNYDFYTAQKQIERDALDKDLKSSEKALRKAKDTERESLERKQKLDARGKKKQEKAGLPTISMNTFKNNAEKSTARIKDVHAEKITVISQTLQKLREELPGTDKMEMGFNNSMLHKGKVLITAKNVNVRFNGKLLWKEGLDFQITSGERVAVKGRNGSGKTTLLKMMLGTLQPQAGKIERADINAVYIDQDYSLVNTHLTVYELAQQFNSGGLQEHEVKTRLSRFLFTPAYWNKPCSVLSGGEKMRLTLCCLTLRNQPPDIIVLDEPTNNLDLQNSEMLTAAINEYKGTLLIVSHDDYFLKQVNTERFIVLD